MSRKSSVVYADYANYLSNFTSFMLVGQMIVEDVFTTIVGKEIGL